MRFFRSTLLTLFGVAIGLGLGVVPVNGSPLWQQFLTLWAPPPPSEKKPLPPVEHYAAAERANINKLIQQNASPP